TYMEELSKHLSILNEDFKILQEKQILNLQNFKQQRSNTDITAYLDQIAYRFMKLQETFGKALRTYFNLQAENIDTLSMIDLVRLAEKRNLPITEEAWQKWRELRNVFAHEYSSHEEEIFDALNEIKEYLPQWKELKEALERRIQ
ncbi:MAG: hypothetical protein D6767_03540, partial [Candidatus Hydrogenedentota bacterium]